MQELGQPGAEPCRVDLLTGDIGRSIEFYGELFGWTTRGVQPDDADPLEMYLGDELVAGFLRNDPQSAYGDTWITYLNVTDAHAASYSAEMYGGYVFLPPVDIEGEGTIADLVVAGEIDMVFNTPSGGEARSDGYELRAAATSIGIPCITTVAEFNAAVQAIEALRTYEWSVTSLQEHAANLAASFEAANA